MNTLPENNVAPSCNIELKARLSSLDAARQVANSLVDTRLPDQHQIDTYFHCQEGRLKLREIVGERAELIAYRRPNESGPKASNYFVLPVEQPERFKEALATTLGIRSRVEKTREIYLHQNVRIHLDRVVELGDFLEFEAVLSDQHAATESQQLVDRLRQRFSITDNDLLEASYGEMIESPERLASR
ncbi:MAG: class IV adenylate cyclase [Planctomycetes bacterium]|nr:class IV adenylate cyclase [Planctomycetota bacterium]